jgi:hypothetical protein
MLCGRRVLEESVPGHPEMNEPAERSGVIISMARGLGIAADLPAELWPEYVSATVWRLIDCLLWLMTSGSSPG